MVLVIACVTGARVHAQTAAATAKAGGLYLVDVDYPSHYAIPKVSPGPLFLPAELNG